MDFAKKDGDGVSVGHVPDSLMPHTPSHTLRVGAANMGMGQDMSSESESGSTSGDGESDVSDMVVDNSSKFAALSKSRRKSGESDYVPLEEGSRSPESHSESESESNSGGGQSAESDTSAESRSISSKPRMGSLVRRLSDESDRSSCSSSQLTTIQQRRQQQQLQQRDQTRMSPLIKRGSYSPFAKTNTRNILNEVAMRKQNSFYELCPPRRRAAQNVKYKDFYDESEEEVDIKPSYRPRGRRKSPSGSEFEASDVDSEESSAGGSFVVSDDDEDEYRPAKRSGRAGGRGRRGKVRLLV